jgi:phosphohistidine swiveling domain-containing protein
MYGSVVNGLDRAEFEGLSLSEKKELYKSKTGNDFPNAEHQLLGAVEAVFKSWNNDRAKTYRRLNNIPETLGTAVIIQRMVFGNSGKDSGSGTLFTRNPSNGDSVVVGEFMIDAPGEDLVSGVKTPDPLSVMADWNAAVTDELLSTVKKLETLFKDMQDVEFTVENGELFLLQTRNGKRTAKAAVKIAVDMMDEKLISVEDMTQRVTFNQYFNALRPEIDMDWAAGHPALFVGIPASVGVATGKAVFSSENAVNCTEPCILITKETTPDDISGMAAAVGILTATGGATSHAAVVARGMDKPCVVGATGLAVLKTKAKYGEVEIKDGDMISIDGSTGEVWLGEAVIKSGSDDSYAKRFADLVTHQYRCFRTVWKPEQINGAGKVLVATYLLEGSDLEKSLEDILLKVSGRDVVIDVRQNIEGTSDLLAKVFGNPETLSDKYQLRKLGVIEAVTADKSNWKVLAEPGVKITSVPSLPHVKDLSQLIMASGLCVVDFATVSNSLDPEAVLKLVSLKREAGEDLKSFNVLNEVTQEELNTGAVFALTQDQLLRSVLPK